MSESYQPNKPRRFRTPSNPWIPYVGDCKAVNNYLDSKYGVGWMFPKFLNALLRGYSQVVFANNPLTGLIILIALFWADPIIGLGSFVAAVVAVFTALLMRQEPNLIKNGLTTFNAVLIGSVTVSLWTPTFGEELPSKLWAFIVAGSIFSVFLTSALSNIFSSYKFSLPCLTFPFNIVALLLFTCLAPPIQPSHGGLQNETALLNESLHNVNSTASPEFARHVREVTELPLSDAAGSEPSVTEPSSLTAEVNTGNNTETSENIDAYDEDEEEDPNRLIWGNILSGILLSMGQVYGINDIFSSILMYIAVMIYSPIMCLVSIVGAIIATIAGLLFTSAPYTPIYEGLWGFNAILSAASVGGYFIAMTCHTFWTAMANVLFTVLIQQALTIAFHALRLPVFTLPFVLSTLMFLSVSASSEDVLPRVTNFSFPELHRFEYLEKRRLNKLNRSLQSDVHPEEKELVLKDIKVISEDTPTPQPTEGGNGTGGNAA